MKLGLRFVQWLVRHFRADAESAPTEPAPPPSPMPTSDWAPESEDGPLSLAPRAVLAAGYGKDLCAAASATAVSAGDAGGD